MIEIRDYGDGRIIVVYTDDNSIAARLKARKRLIKMVDYYQHMPKGIRCIGKDFYFPKREPRSILRGTGSPQGRTFTLTKFQEMKI